MDPATASVYLVAAAGFGWGAHLLSCAAYRGRRTLVVGAIAVLIASVLVGLLSGPAGLFGWMTVVVGLSEWRRSRLERIVARPAGMGRDDRVPGATDQSRLRTVGSRVTR